MVIRRRPIIQVALAEPPSAPPVARKPVRRILAKVKPIAAVQDTKKEDKAFKRDPDEGPGYGVDYAAIIKRYVGKIKNPKTAIRAMCVQCSCGQLKEVQLCRVTGCALYSFRMGENVFNLRTRRRNAAEQGVSLEEYDTQNGITPKAGDYDANTPDEGDDE